MTAGVPGAGIGGLFYLASALLAPACEAVRVLRGRRRGVHPWTFVARLAALAVSMVGAIAVSGWLVGLALFSPDVPARAAGAAAPMATPQFIARAGVFLAVATLAAVLAGVEVLRVVTHRTEARRAKAIRPGEGRS